MRPRYGRIAVLTGSAVVTAVAVLGGFGLLPSGPQDASAASGGTMTSAAKVLDDPDATTDEAKGADQGPSIDLSSESRSSERRSTEPSTQEATTPAVPSGSGTGRRIVFSESEQRVWLVGASGDVIRTYLVSGSATDNLDPGTYRVYSRSRHAVGIDDSGTMEYFVRFTQGQSGAAIGFHSIPVHDGEPVQTIAQLGTPLSHGCVRQRTADAVALWRFAPVGTTVVVV